MKYSTKVAQIVFTCIVAGSAFTADGASVEVRRTTNVSIPDNGAWVSSPITISAAPAGATVTGIDVSFECIHSYSADLVVDLNADAQGALGNYNMWNREGGSADNPSRTRTGISTFNGLTVNRTWYLYARDYEAGDSGYIDEWTITVYYSVASPPSAPVLTSPGSASSPGTTETDLTPTFRWSSVSGATGYGLYVRDQTTGVLIYDNDNVANTTSLTLPFGYMVAGHQYRWNMRAENASGWSSFSSYRYFQMQDAEPTTYTVTPNPATVGEAAGLLTFTINRSGGTPAETVYVSTTTTEGDANNGDYTGILNQPVSFASGQSSRTVTVTINNDTTVENSETFGFFVQRNSSDPVSTYLAKSTFTIDDNDVLPTAYAVTPNPATVGEAAGLLTFTINRSGGTPAETVYASTTTTEGDANNGDYTGILNQPVSFASGQSSRTVTVTINNDTTAENSETFGFIIQRNSNDPVSTYLAKSTFTITDDDEPPASGRPDPSSAPDIRFALPLASDSPAHYYFDRDPAPGGVLAWNGVTTDGISGGAYDGHGGTDFSGVARNTPVYAAAGGTLIEKDDGHPDGSMSETEFRNGNFVRINHGNDNTGSPIISVYLHLNAGTVTTKPIGSWIDSGELIGGVGMSGQADGLHLHFATQRGTPPNRAAFDPYAASGEASWWTSGPTPITYTITPNPATVDEGTGTLTFLVSRSGGTPAETVYASTTTTEGDVNNGDYTGILNQPVSFASGQSSRTVTVTINNDTTAENSETFGFFVQRNSSDPVSTYLAKSTFTITDNDTGGGGGGAAAPTITGTVFDGSTVTLSVASEPGFEYVLECKTSLSDPAWIPVRTNSGNAGTVILTDTEAVGSTCFYRVRVQ